MMPLHLVDTNVHLRSAQPDSPVRTITADAVAALRVQHVDLVVTLQNLVEFWAVATRPTSARGGLGFDYARARSELTRIAGLFRLLPDPTSVWTG